MSAFIGYFKVGLYNLNGGIYQISIFYMCDSKRCLVKGMGGIAQLVSHSPLMLGTWVQIHVGA